MHTPSLDDISLSKLALAEGITTRAISTMFFGDNKRPGLAWVGRL